MRDNAANVAMAMAKAFHWADGLLDGALANPTIANDQLAALGCGVTSIVLRPFATELALKALYIQERGIEPPHEHDLSILFASLNPATQASLEQRFDRIRQAKIGQGKYSGEEDPLPEVLFRHREDFENWRYLHEIEGEDLNIKSTTLISVIEAALEEFLSREGSTFAS